MATKRLPRVYKTQNCKLCTNYDNDDMVQCDFCNGWYHFACVGVSQDIENQPWMCKACSKKPSSTSTRSNVEFRSIRSNGRTSSSRNKQRKIDKIEEEYKLQLEIVDEKAKLRQQYLDKKFALLSSDSSDDSSETAEIRQATDKWVEEQNIRPLNNTNPFIQQFEDLSIQDNMANHGKPVPKVPQPQIPFFGTGQQDFFEREPRAKAIREPKVNLPSSNRILTSNQIAARHAISKDLPIFNGRPEDWPLFIANFETTTTTCGFSNEENLSRLLKSLKGKALEAVRHHLLLPNAVPQVIQTLRMLFGRPEVILQSLLQKLRSEPVPKADKLETLVNYALSVQNICTIMDVSGLKTHLTNPILLQELVDRLPTQFKLNWAMAKQEIPQADISHFGHWLYEIAQMASSVTIPTFTIESSTFKKSGLNAVHTAPQDAKPKERYDYSKSQKCFICNGECSSVVNCKKFKEFSHDEKWDAVRTKRLCRKCLKGHSQFKCKSRTVCGVNDCPYLHHPTLHNRSHDAIVKPDTSGPVNAHQNSGHNLLFRVVPVTLYGKDVSIRTYAFLDEGSSVTLLEKSLFNHLNLKGVPDPLCLRWTADTVRQEKDSKRVSLEISGMTNGSKKFRLQDVRTVENLNLPTQTVNVPDLIRKYPYLDGLPLMEYADARPEILIGLDNWNLGAPLKIVEGKWNEPVATRTRIGWILHGKTSSGNACPTNFHHFVECDCKSDSVINDLIQDFFNGENFAVKIPNTMIESKENKRAHFILESTTRKIGDRFETGLLWKTDDIKLPDSYFMAKRRLDCLQKKMNADPGLKHHLNMKIQDYIDKGYARKLPPEEVNTHQSRTWYLPIFPVFSDRKPGKIRLVSDAASKVNGISLNDCLLKGPDELVPLPKVLCKFREKSTAIGGDIREMYHQVVIRKEDQHSQRFLWPNPNDDSIDVYVFQVMTFGAACSPSAAQYVKNLNAAQWADKFPRAADAIIRSHYVDDYLDSVHTEEEAIQLAKDVEFVHAQGGFEIRNWLSNSENVLRNLRGDNNTEFKKNINPQPEPNVERVLGMSWCPETDTFVFSVKCRSDVRELLDGKRRPSKREVLRALMSIFDPLGLLSSFLIYGKMLVQKIWRSRIDWDDLITDDQHEHWLRWISLLPSIERISVPRCFSTIHINDAVTTQLHVFVDASEQAYSAVAYLRVSNSFGIDCCLVAAKARVAPLKPISIPRMELQAAVLGSRLMTSIIDMLTLNINQKFYWTDSKTVLYWLDADPRKFRQFVSFRIGEILENTKIDQWHWVPSKQNIADEATKWKTLPDLTSDGKWFRGPSFLREPESMWPIQENLQQPETTIYDVEIKANLVHISIIPTSSINVQRFSNWNRLLRAQAYVIRFADNLMANKLKCRKKNGPLQSDELKRAERELFKKAQFESYPNEILRLSNNESLDKSSSLLTRSPYLDQFGVLRVRGRIDAALRVPKDVRRPIILPQRHKITSLLVDFYHRTYKHMNYETIVNEIRQRFSVPRLRVVVRTARANCQTCKNKNAKPIPPEMAELPAARLSMFMRPFSFVGVDYFGPIGVTVGRRSEKRWGVLFTCLTIRAVHLEIVHSLTADSCIMAVRNFMARRGKPLEIFSDNGTNFKGANNELNRAVAEIESDKLQESFTGPDMKWSFIPPSSPHMGGSWERLVGSVKKILYEIMPKFNLTDEILKNLFAEVEMIVNSRPLTYVPLENEEDDVLTPNHFLLGSSDGTKPPGSFKERDLFMRKQWRKTQQLADQFWRKWIHEYLPTLTRRSKWFEKAKPISIGDVVLLADEQNSRNNWPRGIVVDATPGKDGQVRKVTVKTAAGLLVRPSVKIAVLDVVGNDFGKSQQGHELPGGSVTTATMNLNLPRNHLSVGSRNERWLEQEGTRSTTERSRNMSLL